MIKDMSQEDNKPGILMENNLQIMKSGTEELMDSPGLKAAQLPGKRGLLLCISLVFYILMLSCGSTKEEIPYFAGPDFTPYWESSDLFSLDTLHTIDAFSFTDQEGEVVNNQTFEGKIYVASFFFTSCPGICPKLTANLGEVASAFSDNSNVLFISHSVTPEIDSVEVLKEFALQHGINSDQWHLVTGDQEEIYALARTSYFAEQEIGYQFSTDEFLHTEHFILVDRKGHIRGIYKGTLSLEVEKLIADIRILLNQ
jgi:protein SCO1